MKSAELRISVVIPTYERLAECRRAITSALEQELPALEVLVCDDGSTDGTREALESWARDEPRLTYLRLESNSGPAAARNLGTRRAQGEWVAFLDDDDLWLPEKLTVQGHALMRGRYDVVASDAIRTTGSAYLDLQESYEPERSEFLHHNPIITSTAVVRRSALIAAGGFRETALGHSITGVEDYSAWLELAYRGARFLVLPERLIVYEDKEAGRISASAARQEAKVAAVRASFWLRRPADQAALRAVVRAAADSALHRLRLHPSRRTTS